LVKKAPDFTGFQPVLADGQLWILSACPETIKGKYAIVFFLSIGFSTFVCPSEIIAMSHSHGSIP